VNEPILDQAPKPPGLLPKHVQSWLIVGLAVLMILIMWLTGGKKPQVTSKPGASLGVSAPLVDVNEGKITELQSRIQELQREQLVAQNALTQQSRILATGAVDSSAASGGPGGSAERVEDPIQAERKKRGYLSLFASNVALSYRKNLPSSTPNAVEVGATNSEPGTSAGALPSPNEAASLTQFLKTMQPSLTPAVSSIAAPSSTSLPSAPASSAESGPERKEVIRPAAVPGARNTASGTSYVLFEGTILETVLGNRLDASYSGPVECLVTTDTYSHDRQHLLVPAGTRVLGETRKVQAFGETRLAVLFHRLIMPDGYSVSLDQFKGLNQTGDTGLRDRVDNHYARIFGTSLAIGALGAVAEAGTGGVLTQSGTDRIREGFGTSSAQASQQILEKFLNVLPTITIREGHRVKVYLSGDLALPDYANHTMPSNL
jgi:type IV secretory pathway VirB10-like protein